MDQSLNGPINNLEPRPNRMPELRPNLTILRAKLIFAAQSVVPKSVFDEISSNDIMQRMAGKTWLLPPEGEKQRTRYYVLDGDTWELEQYGTSWEAEIVASHYGKMKEKNSWLEAGNGVVVLVKDSTKYMLFREGFNAETRRVSDQIQTNDHHLKQDIRSEEVEAKEQEKLKELKVRLGVSEEDGHGSILWCHIAAALKKVKGGSV